MIECNDQELTAVEGGVHPLAWVILVGVTLLLGGSSSQSGDEIFSDGMES